MKQYRIIIAGGRDFNNYELLKQRCDFYIGLLRKVDVEIVSGGAEGADKLSERYAKERKVDVKVFPADWAKHNKAAGPIRNKQMADYGTHLIAFWDGKSRGTEDMIRQANKNKLPVKIVRY